MTLQMLRVMRVIITLHSPTHLFVHSFSKHLLSSAVSQGIKENSTDSDGPSWGDQKNQTNPEEYSDIR